MAASWYLGHLSVLKQDQFRYKMNIFLRRDENSALKPDFLHIRCLKKRGLCVCKTFLGRGCGKTHISGLMNTRRALEAINTNVRIQK